MNDDVVRELRMLDITAPEEVEIIISKNSTKVWVNINGLCRLRACQIKNLVIDDERIGGE